MTLRLHGKLLGARISSPSHAISLYHHNDNHTTNSNSYIEIGFGRVYELDRDFILIINEVQQDSLCLQSPDFVDEKQNVALLSFYPTVEPEQIDSSAHPVSMKILVDCSGSMAGDSIESVVKALGGIVDELKPNDRFSLTKFGSTVEHRSRAMWRIAEASRNAAHWWIRNLKADMGGTDLEKALESTVNQDKKSPSHILLITDGEVHGIDSVIQTAKSSNQCVYVVGIGSSPVESHLRRLANVTGGACEFIAPNEEVQPAIVRMFNHIRHSAYKNVRVIWPTGADIKYQTQIDVVRNGDAVNVFAWSEKPVNGTVTLIGTLDGCMEEKILAKAQATSVINSDVVSRIGAFDRIQTGDAAGLDLALNYQLISGETSMLLEHIRADDQKQKDMPTIHKIGQMVPAGWGGTGSVRNVIRYMRAPMSDEISFSKKSSGKPLTKQQISELTKRIKNNISTNKNDKQSAPRVDLLKKFFEEYDAKQLQQDQAEAAKGGTRRKIKMTDRENPLLWSDVNNRKGLTPLGLAEWLTVNEGLYLSDSFEILDLIGVPPEVIDWLDLLFIDSEKNTPNEAAAMNVLIHVMQNQHTLDYLNGRIDSGDWECEVIDDIGIIDCSEYSTELVLQDVRLVVTRLKTMSASTWPNFADMPIGRP